MPHRPGLQRPRVTRRRRMSDKPEEIVFQILRQLEWREGRYRGVVTLTPEDNDTLVAWIKRPPASASQDGAE